MCSKKATAAVNPRTYESPSVASRSGMVEETE